MVNQNSFIFIACRPSGIIAILFWLCIALLLSGDASAANVVQNGDFETGDFTYWGSYGNALIDGASAYSGSYGCSETDTITSYAGGVGGSFVDQTVDLTDVDILSFYYAVPTNSPSGQAWCKPALYIGGSNVWEGTWNVTPYTYKEHNVSGYSGNTLIGFGVSGWTAAGEVTYKIMYDDIVADDTPPTISINTRVTHADTPLTGIIVNCENNTGGFPNENGERYLTPNEKGSKEYIIDLSGNDLQDGFKLEASASSAEVTKLTIDISNLVSSRNYDVYLDNQWIEKIGEVTTYQYDITSFSLHTLELVYTTGDEEDDGGGSGPIEPPKEEDEIIIEDDIITIGNITLTKEEFQLLTIEQIEQMDIPQDVKDKLIRIKSINVDWWKIVLGLCLMATVIEGSRKEGNEIILVVGVIGVIIAAYKLGYFQL